jgi:hypothetical protein
LCGRQFVEGRLEITGDPRSCRLIAQYYQQCYEVSIDGDTAAPVPSELDLVILKAAGMVPAEEWTETDGFKHPKVKDIAIHTGKYNLTKDQIIEVLKKWPLPGRQDG